MTRQVYLLIVVLIAGMVLGSSVMSEIKVRSFFPASELAKDKLSYEETKHCQYCNGFYTGYVAGVHDANGFPLDRIPTEVTLDHICTLVAEYIDEHPEAMTSPAADVVARAIKEAFPENPKPAPAPAVK